MVKVGIAEKALVLKKDDTIGVAISKMLNNNKQEAIVIDKNKINGAIFARSFVNRKISKPEETKITRFIEHIKPISSDTDTDSIIDSILVNDHKSIPLLQGKAGLFITKLGILNEIRDRKELKGKTAADIMNPPFAVSIDDTMSTAISVIRETGVSRLPIVNNNGIAEGLVDSLSILRIYTEKSKMKPGEEIGEKKHLSRVKASVYMKKEFPRIKPDTSIKKTIELMIEKQTPTAIVEENKKITGIITPKSILKLFSEKPKTPHVRIIGISEENSFIKSLIDKEIGTELKKMEKILPISYLVMHIEKYHGTGSRKEYSVKGRIITGAGMFFANYTEWDLNKAIKAVLAKFEKEILRKIGKNRIHKKPQTHRSSFI